MSVTPCIDNVRARAYEIPNDAPGPDHVESDGTLEWTSTVLVVVEVDAGGRTGLGYTYAHQSLVPLIEGKLASAVRGRDAMAVRQCWDAMLRQVRNLGTTGLAAMAVSAVDSALWDLKARLLDLPLTALLGALHDGVPVYGSGGFTSYDDDTLAGQLSGWVQLGIPRVKLKVGRHPERDPERMHVARKAVGDDVEVYVDANGAYSPREAVEWAARFRHEFGVRWLEEPLTSDDLDGLRFVRESAPGGIDIAAGEYGWSPWYFERMLAARAVDCLQVDVTRALGITGFLAAAALCDAYHVDLSAHCAPQLSAQVCTAVRRLRHLEYFHDHVRIESMLFDGVLQPDGGALVPDRSRPGHGLALKADEAECFRVA